jgi:hypothetical protein
MKIAAVIYIIFGAFLPLSSFSQVQIPSLKNSVIQHDGPIVIDNSRLRYVEMRTSETVTLKGRNVRLTKVKIEADEIILGAPITTIRTSGDIVMICRDVDLSGHKIRFRKRFPFVRTHVSIEYSGNLIGDGLEIYGSNYQRVSVVKKER